MVNTVVEATLPREVTMFRRLFDAPRYWKILIVLSVDAALIQVSLLCAFMLRMSDVWPTRVIADGAVLFGVVALLGTGLALLLRIPQIRLSAFDLRGLGKIGGFSLILAGLASGLNAGLDLGAPRSVPMIFGPVLFCALSAMRLAGFAALNWLRMAGTPHLRVAVYGAGAAGVQVISGFARSGEIRLRTIVDDKPALQGAIMSGVRVQPPSVLADLARRGEIDRILLTMPSVPRYRLDQIARGLRHLPCEVRVMPGYAELVQDVDATADLRALDTDDLLCRGAVPLDIPNVSEMYAGRNVLIAGAGGSIGAELCRQIIACGPARIVLFEQNEHALYQIDREIHPLAESEGIDVVCLLGSIGDQARVEAVLAAQSIDVVLHAAAYKHVPLVEENIIEGVRNNVLGTQTLAEAARRAGVERFILISTDKAVRPANVMGATKRLAEMLIQDLQTRSTRTKFAMVRFGNVLGSSGSVVPLFEQQIAMGGPITLTHSEITRYFMTLPEAARLVLIAGSYARGGDLFVLDMGEPVRIADLARRMVALSGLSVRDDVNPQGDIEIRITGLRPGEKLYEELLIGENILETPHPKILRAEEACPSEIEVAGFLRELRQCVDQQAPDAARMVVMRSVEGSDGGAEPRIAALVD